RMAEIVAFSALGAGSARLLATVAALLGSSSSDDSRQFASWQFDDATQMGILIGFSLGCPIALKRNA
ncbi:MAG: hypothetical protein ABIO62_13165, partial [Paracoccaceae bacterium]